MSNTHFILDEAASLGKMDCITDALDKYRAYNVRMQLYYQSPAQLKECFPNGQDQTLLANVDQVFFAVNDQSAEYVSGRLGEETIIVESGGTSRGYSSQTSQQGPSFGDSSNSNRNWNQMGRKLLKPEEVYALDERIAITFVAGMPPILTCLERYYERRQKPPRFPKLRVLWGTMQLLVSATLVLAAMVCFLRSPTDVRTAAQTVSGPEKLRAANQSRAGATGNSRRDGSRLGPVQRPGVRSLRSGAVHTDPRTRSRSSRSRNLRSGSAGTGAERRSTVR